MTRIEIEAKILELKKKILGYELTKRRAENQIEDLEDSLVKIKRKEREIHEGFQETLRLIQQKLDKVNRKSKFRIQYLKEAKAALYNSKSDAALEHIWDAQNKIKRKILQLEETVESCNKKIQKAENQIDELRKKTS